MKIPVSPYSQEADDLILPATEFNPPKWKYEAWVIRLSPPHPKSKDKRWIEQAPSNNEWGQFGWSLKTREKAMKQIEEVKRTRGEKIQARWDELFIVACGNKAEGTVI